MSMISNLVIPFSIVLRSFWLLILIKRYIQMGRFIDCMLPPISKRSWSTPPRSILSIKLSIYIHVVESIRDIRHMSLSSMKYHQFWRWSCCYQFWQHVVQKWKTHFLIPFVAKIQSFANYRNIKIKKKTFQTKQKIASSHQWVTVR